MKVQIWLLFLAFALLTACGKTVPEPTLAPSDTPTQAPTETAAVTPTPTAGPTELVTAEPEFVFGEREPIYIDENTINPFISESVNVWEYGLFYCFKQAELIFFSDFLQGVANYYGYYENEHFIEEGYTKTLVQYTFTLQYPILNNTTTFDNSVNDYYQQLFYQDMQPYESNYYECAISDTSFMILEKAETPPALETTENGWFDLMHWKNFKKCTYAYTWDTIYTVIFETDHAFSKFRPSAVADNFYIPTGQLLTLDDVFTVNSEAYETILHNWADGQYHDFTITDKPFALTPSGIVFIYERYNHPISADDYQPVIIIEVPYEAIADILNPDIFGNTQP